MAYFIKRAVESIIDPISHYLSIQVQLENMFIYEDKPGQKRKASDHSIEPSGKEQKTLSERNVELEETEELRQERLGTFDNISIQILYALYCAKPKAFYLLSRSLLLAENDPISSIPLEEHLCERNVLDLRSQIIYNQKYADIQVYQRRTFMADYIFNNDIVEERALDIIDALCRMSGEDEDMITHNLSKSYFSKSPILFFWHVLQFAKSADTSGIRRIQAYTSYKQSRNSLLEKKNSNFRELNLTDKGLTFIPPEIGQLTNLEKLDLFGNSLSSLPSEIWQLSNLKELSLAHNNLHHLSSEIGQLTKLEKLDLSGNSLSSLPSEIGQLTKLTELLFYENTLKILPSTIGQLTRLRELDLTRNISLVLPPELIKLTQLKLLHISERTAQTIPSGMENFKNLDIFIDE